MTILQEMVEIHKLERRQATIVETLSTLEDRFGRVLNHAQSLMEGDTAAIGDDVFAMMDEVSKRFAAAKRGLSLVNRLQPGPSKAMHTSRIMGNMNRIRGMLRRLEKLMVLTT